MRSDNRVRRARCYFLAGLMMTMVVFVPAFSKVSPSISSAFYPLKVGNRWKYRPGTGTSSPRAKSSTWTVVDITKENGKHLVTLNNSPALDDDAIMVLSLSAGVISEWDSGHKILVEDKPVGFTWSYKVTDYAQRKGLDLFRVTAIGGCRIPNHIFDSCISIEETDPQSRLITLTTYAKGVGPVMYRYTRIGQTHPAGTWVLTEWRLK